MRILAPRTCVEGTTSAARSLSEMPRFFFHIRHGHTVVLDLEGGDFADLSHAHAEAVACARELAAEQVRKGEGLAGRSVDVTDQANTPLATVAFVEVIKTDA